MSTQFTASLKRVLKGKSEAVQRKITVSLDATMNDIEDSFRTKVKDGGYSAYDEMQHTYGSGYKRKGKHHYENWRIRARHSGTSLNYEIRNRVPYAKYLYTMDDSPYHPLGFRSGSPHHSILYKGNRYERENQVDINKMRDTVSDIKKRMTKSLNKAFKGNIKASTTYKGDII